MFWKEVKRIRKGEQARDEMVTDVCGQILRDGVEVRRRWAEYCEQVLNVVDDKEANRRWAEYCEQVLNVVDDREANINVVGNWRMPVLGD